MNGNVFNRAPGPKEDTPPMPQVIRAVGNREVLATKLEEYKVRRERYKDLPDSNRDKIDTAYKISILEPLVESGEVRPPEIAAQWKALGTLNDKMFLDASLVIEAYVKNRGVNLSHGTGLPKPKAEEDTGA